MAYRTLRRPYNGAVADAGIDGSAVSSIDGSEPKRISGESNADSQSIGNGADSERDTERNGGSVRVVEVDPSNLSEYIARDSNAAGTDSGSDTRQRRKRGPNKRTTGAKKAADSVKPFLMLAHQWAAVLLKTPELVLTESEAEQLNAAYVSFCEYHEIPILSAKRMSEINLIAAMCLVYGPRYITVRNRHREEKRAKNAKNVTPIAAVN
jgi:hypothetical protein